MNKNDFRPVVKDRLFYNRFEYSMNFRLDEVSCLRELNHEYIDTILNRRIHYREISQQRSIKSTILTRRWREITDETRQQLHTLADLLLNSTVEFKLVTSVETAYVYTNDIDLLDKLSSLSYLRYCQYSYAYINRPQDTVKLKKSSYSLRSYMRRLKLTAQEKQTLLNFFSNQLDTIRLSPAMINWFENPYVRTEDYFFIDYNSPTTLTMLALVRPGLIRKTVDIVVN